jgi:hypothetical protein
MNWKGFRRKRSTINLEGLGKTTKKLRIVDVLAENRT